MVLFLIHLYIVFRADFYSYIRRPEGVRTKMPIIGFRVTRKEREEYAALAKKMGSVKLPHPQVPGNFIMFLPPGSGLGKLVRFAVRQYCEWFVNMEGQARQAAKMHANLQQGPAATQLTASQIQAVKEIMAGGGDGQ